MAAATSAASKRSSSTTEAPRSSAWALNRTATEWYSGEQVRWVSFGPEPPHRRLVVVERGGVPSFDSTPGHTPLGRPDVPDV